MIALSRPELSLVPSYLDFIDEMRQAGETIWGRIIPGPGEPAEDFVKGLLRAETAPEPPWVTQSTYWATVANEVVGRIALRHRLNEELAEFGGHIGYEVRPSARRRGVAKQMLELVLKTPKAREINRLLLTCSPDNVASNRTILANGGILWKTAFVEKQQRQTSYYWIDLGAGNGNSLKSG